MSNIVLSAGIRSNLLALQQNSADQEVVNSALSTGKKVNTALDDPLKYFSAQNFDTRGQELGALLDNLGLGINTIKQANDGITALNNTIQTLQAQLRNALQNASTNAKLASGSNTNGQLLNWGPDYSGKYPSLLTPAAPAGTTAGPFTNGATLAISATRPDGTAVALNTRTFGGSYATVAPTAGATLKATYAGTLPLVINSAKDLATAINYDVNNVDTTSLTIPQPALVHASVDAGGRFIIENVSGTPTTTGAPAAAGQLSITLAGTGVSAAANDGLKTLSDLFGRLPEAVVPLANPLNTSVTGIPSVLNKTRATAGATYASTLQQITNIAKDAGYNGTNLLYGDSLNLVLNENNTTNLVVTGVIYDSTGLNLKRADVEYNLQSDTEITTALTTLQTAYDALQAQAAAFATNNTIATTRQQFTTKTIKTLTDGSSLLTLADQNEEGASLLALQTRQQLSTQALSLANQSDKAVLRLFN